jgi:hypothetical protein
MLLMLLLVLLVRVGWPVAVLLWGGVCPPLVAVEVMVGWGGRLGVGVAVLPLPVELAVEWWRYNSQARGLGCVGRCVPPRVAARGIPRIRSAMSHVVGVIPLRHSGFSGTFPEVDMDVDYTYIT